MLRETQLFLHGASEINYIQQPKIIFHDYCIKQPFVVGGYKKPILLAAKALERGKEFWVMRQKNLRWTRPPYMESNRLVIYRLWNETFIELTGVIQIMMVSGEILLVDKR